MCGIVGVIGRGEGVVGAIVDGLKRLEYRGYDSAGVAVVSGGRLERRRAAGKLSALEAALAEDPVDGAIGIGHTRWATHGAPTTRNAHPHATDRVAIVHNGIIENFAELRAELEAAGRAFHTDTDSETIAQLITHLMEVSARAPRAAFAEAVKRLSGAFAIVAVFAEDPETLYAARLGSPLAVGRGEGAAYLGSDAYALAPFTNKVTYLSDGDWAVVTRTSLEVFDAKGAPAAREEKTSDASAALVDKGEHRHFMAKEIHEQPEVIGHTLSAYIDTTRSASQLPAEGLDFAAAPALTISACGTAYYAGLVAKYWFERWARLPVEIDIASELRYRDPPYRKSGIALFVSQSGETADTLAALRHAKENGQTTAAIVNVPESTIAREADVVLPT
ncbi:MAG: glutamine--fructose-6-phosphate transaminase (isomerizing), partial [Pseudomonadota bacterium]